MQTRDSASFIAILIDIHLSDSPFSFEAKLSRNIWSEHSGIPHSTPTLLPETYICPEALLSKNIKSLTCIILLAESDTPGRGKSICQQAIFRVNGTLSIPNISMVPALEEVQQALNRAVECVVSVSKGVSQWSKERISKVCLIE